MNEQIKSDLKVIIQKVAGECFNEGYTPTDEEVFGLIVSKFFEWEGLSILKVAHNALEDANFHTENEQIADIIKGLEGEEL